MPQDVSPGLRTAGSAIVGFHTGSAVLGEFGPHANADKRSTNPTQIAKAESDEHDAFDHQK
jgi:hypothetical protein